MNRNTARVLALTAIVLTAALGACAKQGEKSESMSASPRPAASSGGWGAGPYSEWKPIK